MKRLKLPYIFIAFIAIGFAFSSCSTKKNKWPNRTYHAVVSHYNTWWNGNDALKQGVKELQNKQNDDYSRVLPVFKLGSKDDAVAIKPNMDRAIEKGSKAVKKHSMLIDGMERNSEIDDAYLLIGKACFYNQEYKTAIATFKHIISGWRDKKEMYEPMIWLALSYCKTKEYSLAESTLDQVRNKIEEGKAPKRLNKLLYCVYSEVALEQGKYAKASEYLRLANYYSNNRELNTRLMFIQGQLYKNAGRYDEAIVLFRKTASRAKNYEMEFASRLNQAVCYNPKTSNSKSIISKLEKMSLDKKNEDYKDQIYYALGEIYFKDKNVDKACELWRKSVSNALKNENQKITSALRLADTYYDLLEKYEDAQMYYDTAISAMKKDYPNYDKIVSKQKVLTNLVQNLRIVSRWDSLLALSQLTTEELDKKVQGFIDTYKKQEQEKKEAEIKAKALAAANATMTDFTTPQNKSSWYFYNNQTLQSGKSEFTKIWGDRKLEDNWRVSDRMELFAFDDNEQQGDDIQNSDDTNSVKDNKEDKPSKRNQVSSTDPTSKEFYTKDIPFEQAQKDTANAQSSKALLLAGYIYYQGLTNYGKAIETYLELQKRYPNYPTTLPSSYHLYRIYDKIGQTPNSNYYKNKVLKEYPESEFAMMIKNPDYWQELSSANSVAEKLYESVYQVYLSKDYNNAIKRVQYAVDTLRFGPYIPRLLYIEALSKGKLYGIDSLMNELNMIVYNHPNSEITPTIQNQLKYLSANYNAAKNNLLASKSNNEPKQDNSISNNETNVSNAKREEIVDHTIEEDDILDAESLVYRYRNMPHFYVVLCDDDKINASELRNRVSDFNAKYYGAEGLSTNSLLLTLSRQMISVNKFENIEKAMAYYNAIKSTAEVFAELNPDYYKCFVISTQNYPTFYNKKNEEAYMKFFRIFYLKPNEKKD